MPHVETIVRIHKKDATTASLFDIFHNKYVKLVDKKHVRASRQYYYDAVFVEHDQQALYNGILKPCLLQHAERGQNTTLFFYGAKNAGKKYTYVVQFITKIIVPLAI